MKAIYVTSWVENMMFESEIGNHKILMDADENVGGNDKGPRPKPLLVSALTGCTGMDVVSILKKMKVEFDQFDIKVETEMSEEHPKTYTKMHLIYEFTGKDLDINKLQRAADLSQEKYCGVSALLAKGLEITYEVRIIEK